MLTVGLQEQVITFTQPVQALDAWDPNASWLAHNWEKEIAFQKKGKNEEVYVRNRSQSAAIKLGGKQFWDFLKSILEGFTNIQKI